MLNCRRFRIVCLRIHVVLVAGSLGVAVAQGQAVVSINVMTFNVWIGENSQLGRDKLVEIIQAGNADIVGLQEMGSSEGQLVATALGFNYS